MGAKRSQSTGGNSEIAEFWKNFQLLPWKWADQLVSRPRYLIGSTLFVYALFAILTFVPSLGSRRIALLVDYPSVNLILWGWIAVITLVIRWRHKIPSLFQWFRERELARQKAGDLNVKFDQYLQEYQNALLSRKGPQLIALFLSVLIVLFVFAVNMHRFVLFFYTSQAVILVGLAFIVILLWALVIGFLWWALYITGRFIRELPKRFPVSIQPTHPDECGGLKPLGDFCFDIAIPLIGAGLLLVAIPLLNWDRDATLGVFSVIMIFVVIGPLTILTVFFPLWDIHAKMVEHKQTYENAYAIQVVELEQAIHVNTRMAGDLSEAKSAREKLEILQTLHPEKLAYPTWPFKFTKTVLAMLSPQILQTLTVIVKNVHDTFS